MRPFHDARHGSLTNGAAAGETPIALMARAGHRSMATTNQYVHLAGGVFHDEAAALEERMLGTGRKFYPTSRPHLISWNRGWLRKPVREPSYLITQKRWI